MANLVVQHIGIAWFRPADYQRIRTLFVDGDGLPRLYSDWLKFAEKAERQIKASGKTVHRAIIDPNTFPAWCEGRGLKIDSQARMAFANAVAYSRAKHGDGEVH